jgi:glyoxylase-like metal-dependent hydrolase (beta-lactamase superfamily II)
MRGPNPDPTACACPMKLLAWPCALVLFAAPLHAAVQSAWRATATGELTDATHPQRPGDFKTYRMRVEVRLDEAIGEAELVWTDLDESPAQAERRWWRRGRLFQSDPSGAEQPAEGLGDLAPAALAMIHPGLLSAYLRERPENADNGDVTLGASPTPPRFIAANDVLWRVESTPAAQDRPAAIRSLTRLLHHDIAGSQSETIAYEGPVVTITRAGRRIARFEFGPQESQAAPRCPLGDPGRDEALVIPPEDFVFLDYGGGLFGCELERANSRVFVVEFEDRLLVFEGTFTSRNTEHLAQAVKARFGKPVTHFAFSHIHGQYLGGVRAWAAQGATVLAPPSSLPAIRETLAAPFGLRPDAWSRAPGPLRLEAVPQRWHHADERAEVLLINDPQSDHTDEYLLVYLPRTKTLLTGDLLFYRPGQPLRGRSLTLARYIAALGLQVDRCLITWPLDWPGKNDLTGADLRQAAEAGERADPDAPR